MSIKDNSKKSNYEESKKIEENSPCDCEKICICKCDKLSYNNENCCYLQPKDICIVQINDPNLFQIITDNQNLYLTDDYIEINTSSYKIESSVIDRTNDTLVINESGVYSIYAKKRDIFRVDFKINGNDKEIFEIDNTIVVPNIVDDESEEIINTIQGSKLQIIEENLPYKINISLKNFEFDLTYMNQIIVSDLILIVEKII